jgi:hypothetical protein
MEELIVHSGHEVLMIVDSYFTDCLKRVLDQQVRPHPVHLLNINIIVSQCNKKLRTIPPKVGKRTPKVLAGTLPM